MTGPIITAFVWDSYARGLAEASKELGVDVRTFTRMSVNDGPEAYDRFVRSAEESDLVLVHLMGADVPEYVLRVLEKLPESAKVLTFGKDPMSFINTTGPKEAALKCCEYLSLNGKDNVRSCLLYLLKTMYGWNVEVPEVERLPMQGILDTEGKRFGSIGEFIAEHPPIPGAPWVGIITSRTSWVNDNCDVEYDLVRRFNSKGINAVLVYSSPRTIPQEDMLGLADSVMKYMFLDGKFLPSAMIKTTVLLYGQASAFGQESEDGFLKTLDVPVFQPVIPSSMTKEAYKDAPGLKRDVSYDITFQEFEGTIEPILIGFSREDSFSEAHRRPITERAEYFVDRVIRRIKLRTTPNSEKKVAFFLNNYPCAGAEANVGEDKDLNVMDSLANILRRMKEEGYTVDAPDTGKGLMECIMEHKALSDFRWTNATEIERCGGVLYHMSPEEYGEWFSGLSDKVKDDVRRIWGEPPGEAMIGEGKILITGVRFGNVLVMVQPKR
ncbi:MAG: cobaltochelatase subunit CobN, partial [Candidatus Methanomethylophilaceae archaeon]|nr:cobaltochelatase subunit CobN [Candidatus Methanomethylophilaceae archaeon]